MRRITMQEALVAGVNAAAKSHTNGATLKPWGTSETIEVPGLRYLTFTPPLGEATETMEGTVSGWIRGMEAAEDTAAAIVKELHGDAWRTWRDSYWRVQFAGIRLEADDEPGVFRFDLDFEMEMARDVAYRY